MDKKVRGKISIEEYREKLDTWYKANNIIRERSDLYHDFIYSLIQLIDETYLGKDVIETQEDMVNHFTWCFNKVIEDFEKERIKFSSISTTAYDYLWYFLYKGYYTSDLENPASHMLDYFDYLFDFNSIKGQVEIESYIDFYKIFDQNLKKLN